MQNLVSFFQAIYYQRNTFGQLVKRDFKKKYLASYLGLPWAFIKQGALVFTIWFALSIGLNINVTPSGLPLFPWIVCGLIPWFFINEAIHASKDSLIEYSYLIKETNFKVAVIPLIKVLTAFIIHLFFIAVIALIAIYYGYYPNIYWIQILYLIIATFILLTGIGWLISSINVFIRDVGQIVSIILSVLFWITPIIWSYSVLDSSMRYIALLNPFFYIIEGYRYAFLGKAWMMQNVEMTVYFWVLTVGIFLTGAITFKKLSSRFIDAL
jgi:ABC-type polysaccharide/polyol phosphate export permease